MTTFGEFEEPWCTRSTAFSFVRRRHAAASAPGAEATARRPCSAVRDRRTSSCPEPGGARGVQISRRCPAAQPLRRIYQGFRAPAAPAQRAAPRPGSASRNPPLRPTTERRIHRGGAWLVGGSGRLQRRVKGPWAMVTEEEWHGEMAKAKRLRFISPLAGLVVLGLLTVPAVAAGRSFGSGVAAYLTTAGVLIALLLPLVYRAGHHQRPPAAQDRREGPDAHPELSEAIEVADREGVTRELQGQRQRFESRLANALDMAEGEPEVIDVIERSFAAVVPDAPVELLLADNSHAHLLRMAGVGPDGEPPCCSVDSPDRCPAARRAQVQVFGDSDHLDACPKLRNRPQGRLSALCVPVSIMGRTVGVIHATDKPEAEVEDSQIQDLTTLAKLAGRTDRPAPGHGRDPAAGVDRHADRAAQPPLLLGEGGRRAARSASGGGGHGRPRPLQEPERHLRARDRRQGSAAVRPRPARLAPGAST